MNMNEEWRDIQGYEGLYQVSNLGRVKSLDREITAISRWGTPQRYIAKGRIRKVSLSTTGYPQVQLSKDGRTDTCQVHRLVAAAFIANPNNLPEVNHKNEDKCDNKACNLEWCTREYNAHYLNACTRHARKIWKRVRQITLDGKFVAEYPSVREASKANGISVSYISKAIHGAVSHINGHCFELV